MSASMKKILRIHPGNGFHWVGDGFKVNNYFPGHVISAHDASPFFLLDYNAPIDLAPSTQPRGVGTHPHKGFETVSIIWAGAVSHHDSAGNSGSIGPGDVQWMTAGSGILHKEYHESEFTKRGGKIQMVQLWVNLPAKDKLSSPKYQDLRAADIPNISFPDEAGYLRLIAGNYADKAGVARTFTSLNLYDVHLNSDKKVSFNFMEGDTLMVLVASGQISANNDKVIDEGQIAYFDRSGTGIELMANKDAHFLVLSGTPINEPIAHYGPFVMNTQEEIITAVEEFRNGKFGILD
jgi:quercetin 2,3-dioxygenase